MELDELKHIWQDTQQNQHLQPLAEQEILRMTQQKSQSIIAKLKRNVWIEFVFGLICVPLIGYYIFAETSILRWVALAALVLLWGFLGFYFWGIKQLQTFEKQASLRMALQQLIQQLTLFIRLYYVTNVLLTPFAFFAGAYWATYAYSFGLKLSLSLTLVSTPLIFGFVQWFVKQNYRKHLEHLNTLLKELETA